MNYWFASIKCDVVVYPELSEALSKAHKQVVGPIEGVEAMPRSRSRERLGNRAGKNYL